MEKRMRIGFLCLFFWGGMFFSAPAFASSLELPDILSNSGWYLIKLEIDTGNNGTMDVTQNYHYNSDHQLVRFDSDAESDGTIEVLTHLIYDDSNGNMIRNDIDLENNGTIDYSINCTYDLEGHLIRESIDYDGNGTSDYYADFIYDGDDKVRTDVYFSGLHHTITYTYHSNTIIEERDDYSDGDNEIVITYIYNSSKKPIEERWDYDDDGDIDLVTTCIYDSHGNLERENTDKDNDGDTDDVTYYTWVRGSGGSDDDDDDANDKDNDGDGYSVNQGDCDDRDKHIHPGAIEICWDGIDQNCNGQIDESCGRPGVGDYPVVMQSTLSVKKVGKFNETSAGFLRLENNGTFEMDDSGSFDDVNGTYLLDAKGKSILLRPNLAALEDTLIDWLEDNGLYNLDFNFDKVKISKLKIDKKTQQATGKIKVDVSGTVYGCMPGEGCGEVKFKYKAMIVLLD